MNLKVFQRGGKKQHKHLVPCCRITLNLNQSKPNSYYGIVAYAFTLLWDNLCRNSCISRKTAYLIVPTYGQFNSFTPILCGGMDSVCLIQQPILRPSASPSLGIKKENNPRLWDYIHLNYVCIWWNRELTLKCKLKCHE